jgi:hypothetical protein
MVDADDVVIDDRSIVELLGDLVGRRSDQLHPRSRAPVWVGPGECGQERAVDVDRRHTHALKEVAAQYLQRLTLRPGIAQPRNLPKGRPKGGRAKNFVGRR